MRKCSHSWEEIHRDVRRGRPPTSIENAGGYMSDDVRDIIFGVTLVELRCEHCGDLTGRRIRGEHPK